MACRGTGTWDFLRSLACGGDFLPKSQTDWFCRSQLLAPLGPLEVAPLNGDRCPLPMTVGNDDGGLLSATGTRARCRVILNCRVECIIEHERPRLVSQSGLMSPGHSSMPRTNLMRPAALGTCERHRYIIETIDTSIAHETSHPATPPKPGTGAKPTSPTPASILRQTSSRTRGGRSIFDATSKTRGRQSSSLEAMSIHVTSSMPA